MSAPDEISVPVRPSPGQPAYDRGPAGQAAFEAAAATQSSLSKEQRETLFRSGAQAAADFVIRRARAGHVPGNG